MFRIFEPSVDALHDAQRARITDAVRGTIRIFVLHLRSRLSMTPKEAVRFKKEIDNHIGTRPHQEQFAFITFCVPEERQQAYWLRVGVPFYRG